MKTFTKKIIALTFFLSLGLMTMAQFNVTFHVNMTDATFNPDSMSVFIAGSFLGWEQPGSNLDYMLTPTIDDPMIYEGTFELAEAQEIQYKYFLVQADSSSWDSGEWGGDPNRTIVPIEEVTVEDVWADMPYAVTFNVDMTNADPFDPATDQIFMSGNVCIPNNWSMPGSVPNYEMTVSPDNDMIYTLTILLYTGDYQYKFFRVVDSAASWDNGEWTGDPNRDLTVDSASMTVDKTWGLLSGIHNSSIQSFSVYPNPVSDALILQDVQNAELVEVYNIAGELVSSLKNVATESLTINTADFNQGVYMVTVHTNGVIRTAKFLKK